MTDQAIEKRRMSFMQALLDFFGKNGKDTAAFMAEVKALTQEDKDWFRQELSKLYDLS